MGDGKRIEIFLRMDTHICLPACIYEIIIIIILWQKTYSLCGISSSCSIEYGRNNIRVPTIRTQVLTKINIKEEEEEAMSGYFLEHSISVVLFLYVCARHNHVRATPRTLYACLIHFRFTGLHMDTPCCHREWSWSKKIYDNHLS